MTLRPGLAEEILSFWFGEGVSSESEIAHRVSSIWFAGSEEIDEELTRRFRDDLEAFGEDALKGLTGLEERLAAIVLLDQFSRNIFRDAPDAFARDHLALSLAKGMIEAGEDRLLDPAQRVFVYMALEHSEDGQDQDLSVKKFQELCRDVDEELKPMFERFLDYAHRHKVIIDQFGRYPHRNEILGRASTGEEIEFLKQPGSSF
jgi:uncharacterized protein (DUF924 family)